MNPVTAMKDLADALRPLIDPGTIGEEQSADIIEKIETLERALADPKILGDIERKVIGTFEDWEDRVYDTIEFVRPDNTIAQFQIHSITTTQQRAMRHKREAAVPPAPVPRDKGDGPDLNDPHYKKEMRDYERQVSEIEDLTLLWILEAGLDFEIPGKDDAEKMEFLSGKIAGDAIRIAQGINEISNLTPDSLRPFLRG